MINRSQIKFHETFQPESTYLAKILDLASRDYSGDKFSISEITGIPTGKQKGKVEPHIKYASYMGMVDVSLEKNVYSLSLTALGKTVFEQDRFLHENLSRWLCHYEISRRSKGAPQWRYIVHEGHSAFSQINTTEYHLTKANTLFGTSVEQEEMFGVVKRCYTDGFFSGINYLRWDDGIEYIEHWQEYELFYVYAYALLDSWIQLYPQKEEITLDDIVGQIGFGKVFNFCEDEVDCALEDLASENIIKINRQLYPVTVLRLESIETILQKLYSRLL